MTISKIKSPIPGLDDENRCSQPCHRDGHWKRAIEAISVRLGLKKRMEINLSFVCRDLSQIDRECKFGDIDDDAFPRFADPALVASQARALGIGLNWLLTSNLKLQFNLTQTQFEGGATLGANRPDENAFFSRVQVAF